MPTGYTAAIADGIGFEQFVMRCARAMGACVLMRGDPMDAPIPERFEPSDYHAKRLAEAKNDIARLRAMSAEEAEAAARTAFEKATAANVEALAKKRDLRTKYEAMLAQVEAWTPPTSDHEGFKNFMLGQLRESIQFDCDESYYEQHKPKQLTGKEWWDEQLSEALRDVEYHTKNHDEEVARTENRIDWLKSLRTSLATHNAEVSDPASPGST